MEITGKIIGILPERTGISPRTGAEWKMASYLLETTEQYPRKMVFDVFGADRIAQFGLQLSGMYTISFDIDAREYQGKWFNSVRAWRAVPYNPATAQPGQPVAAPADIPPFAAAPVSAQQPNVPMGGSANDRQPDDQLPF